MDYKGFVNTIRGLVRPVISLGGAGVLFYQVAKVFISEQIALIIVGAFIALVSAITAFWFASRQRGN